MPIGSIITQPGHLTEPRIVPAYRPVIFRVSATRTDGAAQPPVVYCDVYFDDVYYKTIQATQYAKLNTGNTEWKFDISDVCQEYLRRDLPVNGGADIIIANRQTAQCFVRFRSSGYDDNNFIAPEGIAPIQGTGTRAPADGSGDESESFVIINATLQHEDNQDFITHLDNIPKNGTWDAEAYPLTHRPNPNYLCKNNSDYFPFIYLGNKSISKMRVVYTPRDGSAPGETDYEIPQTCSSVVSDVTPVVQPNNDVEIGFTSSGPATIWEYRLNDGSWLVVPGNPFTVSFNQLLMYIITEAGEPIVTDDDGNIIIPESVDIYDTSHGVDIRPRCTNGVYGTTGSATFEVPSAPVCEPITQFEFGSIDYANEQIILLVDGLPTGETDFQLEWKFDYGGGFITSPVIHDRVWSEINNIFQVSNGYENGTFKFRVRTKCGEGDYSAWSPEVSVPYESPLDEVQVTIDGVINLGGIFQITISISEAVADNILLQGVIVGFNSAGTIQSFNFTMSIPAGSTSGTATVSGAAATGGYMTSDVTAVSPDPTSDSKSFTY
jgi:hypothetical protein